MNLRSSFIHSYYISHFFLEKTKFTYTDLQQTTLKPGKYQCINTLCDDLRNGLATFILANTGESLTELQEKINKHLETEKEPFDADDLDLCIAAHDGISNVYFFYCNLFC